MFNLVLISLLSCSQIRVEFFRPSKDYCIKREEGNSRGWFCTMESQFSLGLTGLIKRPVAVYVVAVLNDTIHDPYNISIKNNNIMEA